MKYWQIFYINSNNEPDSLPEKYTDQHKALELCNKLNKISDRDQYKVIEG